MRGWLPVLTLLAAILLQASGAAAWAPIHAGGLVIAVTFPNLAYDVRLIACSGDSVVSVAPSGVDPHSYQLTPRDVELLRQADIIVSTGHAPFEAEIRRQVEDGLLKARLIEIPRIPGLRLEANPATGEPNYHMPIYDPGNYEVFLRYLAETLEEMRPGCREIYQEHLASALRRLGSITSSAPRLSVDAVGDTPLTQYAVGWLGVRVRMLVVREHGVAASPQDLGRIEEAMREGKLGLAVVVSPAETPASKTLLSMAERNGVPVLMVPSPLGNGSMLDKLAVVAQHARTAAESLSQAPKREAAGRGNVALPAATAVLVLLISVFSIGVVLRERRGLLDRSDALLVALSISTPLLFLLLYLGLEARWVVVMVSAAIAYGFLSPVIAARRLYFLAGASPHAALLAAVAAIPLASSLGLGIYAWSMLVGLGLIYIIGYMVYRGMDPDTSTAVFVAFAASASVLAIYYVLTRYPRETDIMAIVVGDPLLAGWREALYAVLVALASAAVFALTYREQVCIGVERDSVRLTGIRVALYDFATFTMLAVTTVLLIRIVGFVLEHVLILLPAAIASTAALGAMRSLVISVNVSLAASLLGLWLATWLDLAPAGVTGILLLAAYLAVLALRRR